MHKISLFIYKDLSCHFSLDSKIAKSETRVTRLKVLFKNSRRSFFLFFSISQHVEKDALFDKKRDDKNSVSNYIEKMFPMNLFIIYWKYCKYIYIETKSRTGHTEVPIGTLTLFSCRFLEKMLNLGMKVFNMFFKKIELKTTAKKSCECQGGQDGWRRK